MSLNVDQMQSKRELELEEPLEEMIQAVAWKDSR